MMDRVRHARRTDWFAWHRVYDDPESRFSARLLLVQAHLREALDHHPPGPIRIVVPCAGQGRDVLGVLAEHPRRGDVTATLVDIDPHNVEIARSTAHDLGLAGITVVEGDAGRTDAYVDAAPASVVVLVGFFIYLSERDLSRFIQRLPQLCARGAVVIWARGTATQKHAPSSIRQCFETAGFRAVASDVETDEGVHIAVERFDGTPEPLVPGTRLFSFRDPLRITNNTLRRARRRVMRSIRGRHG
jgi:hypothetical protein